MTDTQNRRALSSRARNILGRERLNAGLDAVRFRVDSFPARDTIFGAASYVRYQPLPWLGRPGGRRAQGTYDRWRAMQPLITELGVTTALDLGANAGFFTFSLVELGVATVAVEDDPTFIRTAMYVSRRTKAKDAGIFKLKLTPRTVTLLPQVDAVLCLSLWHHFVKAYGFEAATVMLEEIWNRTRRVLVFDTGETEMPASFGLPDMTPTAREWLSSYLAQVCHGGTVRHLGQHGGFYQRERNLFAVVRS